jgi:hypothetical protein
VTGAAVAVAVAVAFMQAGLPSGPSPNPFVPTTTPAVRVLPDGVAFSMMPMEGTEAQLPAYAAGLPSVIDTHAPAQRMSSLSKPVDAFVAVYLREVGQRFQPVLVLYDGTQVLVDRVTLAPTRVGADLGAPLGVRAVGNGYDVLFAQPGAVLWLDVRTGAVHTIPVPDPQLIDAGWTTTQLIVARSPTRAWTIDPWEGGGSVRATSPAAYAGQVQISAHQVQPDSLVLTPHDDHGVAQPGVTLSAPVTGIWGDTVSTQGRAASGVFFDQFAVHSAMGRGAGPIDQGLIAARTQGDPNPRLLLAPESPVGQTGRFTGCCTALGWADESTVLLRAYGSHGVWVLAWDVDTGSMYQVAWLGALSGSGRPTPIALNVGKRD